MKVYTCDQYSDEWWRLRRGVPTASEFSCIITPKERKYSAQSVPYIHRLIADRFDQTYGHPDEYASKAMINGAVMEPETRRFYEFERGVDVQQVGFCLGDDGRFGCSPDSLVADDGLLEIKRPLAHTQVKYLLTGGVPPEYVAQCHGELIVTERKWIDFLSYAPGLPHLLVRVEWDDYTDALKKAMEQFWTNYQNTLAKFMQSQAA